MKKFVCLLSLVFVASLVSAAEQAAKPAPAKKATAAATAVKTHTLQAEVVAMDATAKTLTIKGEKENSVLPVGAKAEASLSALKVGEKVKLTCQDNEKGEHLVVKIKPVTTAKHHAKKHTAAPAPAAVK
jgi:Cu/Ag efflux protein CusF